MPTKKVVVKRRNLAHILFYTSYLLIENKNLLSEGKRLGRNDYLINELDRKFANYYNYNKEIAIRKEELKMREADENIGGGKSNIRSRLL